MSFADKKLSEIAISVPGSTALLRELGACWKNCTSQS